MNLKQFKQLGLKSGDWIKWPDEKEDEINDPIGDKIRADILNNACKTTYVNEQKHIKSLSNLKVGDRLKCFDWHVVIKEEGCDSYLIEFQNGNQSWASSKWLEEVGYSIDNGSEPSIIDEMIEYFEFHSKSPSPDCSSKMFEFREAKYNKLHKFINYLKELKT